MRFRLSVAWFCKTALSNVTGLSSETFTTPLDDIVMVSSILYIRAGAFNVPPVWSSRFTFSPIAAVCVNDTEMLVIAIHGAVNKKKKGIFSETATAAGSD